jgi:monoamine oxidase
MRNDETPASTHLSDPSVAEHEGLRRRELLAGGAAAALAPAVIQPERRRLSRPRIYDVAVVGAGLAGLTAAHAIRAAGRTVVVLEARKRVGGRNLDHHLGAGKVAELGGQWAAPGQDRVLALAKKLGVPTFPTFSSGANVYYRAGRAHRYSGDIPPASLASLIELQGAIVALNGMAASVVPEHPWTVPQATNWDQQSIGSWSGARLVSQEARDLLALAVRGVYGEEPTQVSLLDLLAAISGVGGDINTLIGAAQSIRFVGGPQQLSEILARQLGGAVHLGVAITAVAQGQNVTLHAAHASYAARRAILTPPKPLIGRLIYSPALPAAVDQILQRQPMGSVIKVNAIYPTPFWRGQGLSGAATSDTGPIRITYDNSPPDGKPGILVGFMEGDDSRTFYGARRAVRRQAALASFARYFGRRALQPVGYVDMVWADQVYTRGAYGSFNPPGVLTSLHDATAGPVGALHFAGADTSPQWPGYMDGAIRSGEQAATEALSQL